MVCAQAASDEDGDEAGPELPCPSGIAAFLADNDEFQRLISTTGGPFANAGIEATCSPRGIFCVVSRASLSQRSVAMALRGSER